MRWATTVFVLAAMTAASPAADLKEIEASRLPAGVREKKLRAFESNSGTILAPTRERAETLAKLLDPAAEQFKLTFGRPAPRLLLAATEKEGIDPEWRKAFKCDTILPWFAEDNYRETVAARVKAEYRKQNPNASEAELDKMTEQALAKTESRGVKQSYDTALAHEAGHNWFVNAFWPHIHGASDGSGYAGPANDWLDEAAAISLESKEMTDTRYRNIPGHLAAGRFVPLAELFKVPHPKISSGKTTVPPGGGKPTLGSGAKATITKEDGVKQEAFYSQIRSVIDFMSQKANRPALLSAIASYAARGKGMEDWLKHEGKRWNLPDNTQDLEKEWKAWLEQRLKVG